MKSVDLYPVKAYRPFPTVSQMMLFDVRGFFVRLRKAALLACGLVMAMTPLALWIAWSQTVFAIVFACALGSVVLLGILLGPDKPPESTSSRAF